MKLEEIRKMLRPNPTRFGAENGFPKASLSNFLNAKHMLTDDLVLKLSELIDVPVDDLRKSFETEQESKKLWREPAVLRESTDVEMHEFSEWIVNSWTEEEVLAWKIKAVTEGHNTYPALIAELRGDTDSRSRDNLPIK